MIKLTFDENEIPLSCCIHERFPNCDMSTEKWRERTIIIFIILVINYLIFYNVNRAVKSMNYSFKLKVKQQPSVSKEEPSVRRIRTDHVDVLKKMTKQPLL